MKQAVVTIKYDEEKLNAVKQYMGKKDADFDAPPAIKKANRQQGKNSVASGSAAENE